MKEHYVFVGGKHRKGIRNRSIERAQVGWIDPRSVGGFACSEPQVVSSETSGRSEVKHIVNSTHDKIAYVSL
jgi:hypothetical protein